MEPGHHRQGDSKDKFRFAKALLSPHRKSSSDSSAEGMFGLAKSPFPDEGVNPVGPMFAPSWIVRIPALVRVSNARLNATALGFLVLPLQPSR